MRKQGWILVSRTGTPCKGVGSDTILIYNKRREADFVAGQFPKLRLKARMIEYDIIGLALRPELYKKELGGNAHRTRSGNARKSSCSSPNRVRRNSSMLHFDLEYPPG